MISKQEAIEGLIACAIVVVGACAIGFHESGKHQWQYAGSSEEARCVREVAPRIRATHADYAAAAKDVCAAAYAVAH